MLVLAPAAAPAAAAPVNLVVNGSFEQPALAGTGTNVEYYGPGLIPYGVGTSYPLPNLKLTGWTVASGSVDVNTTGVWQAADGSQSVDLNGVDPSVIRQDLPTTPGDSYVLSFAMAGNLYCAPAVKTLEVDWNGAAVDTVSFDTTGHSLSNMGYATHTYTVSATSATTTLQFKSLTAGSCGPVIDAVSVTAPSYASLCSLAQQDSTKAGVASSLCAKLSAAEADAVRGNTQAKAGVLGAFAHEVAAQSGKALTPAQAAQLTALAGEL